MPLDHALIVKIAFFNAVGLLISIGGPLVLDPRLTTHVQYGRRDYPYASWLLLLCPAVFLCTYLSLSTSTGAATRNMIFSFLFLAIAGASVAFVFPPEKPHMGVLTNAFAYGLVSFLTVYLHQTRDSLLFVGDRSLEFEARLERLKAIISTWQMITIYGAAGYLAFVIFLISVLWKVSEMMLTDPGERFWFGNLCVFGVCCYSIIVVIGPLHEAFDMIIRATENLSILRR